MWLTKKKTKNRTSAYNGTNPSNDTVQEVYSPIFKTMYTQNLTAPLFSLAILRDVSGPSGYLALGGTPPVDFVEDFTSTPILITTITGYPKTYGFYTIKVDSIELGKSSLAGGTYIVDSGTTLNYVPTPVANAINRAFSPPAVYNEDEGANVVDCKAKAPTLGIKIAGTVFYINPLDMILLAGTDAKGNDICISGVVDGGNDPSEDVYILGDVFQKNVVSVFDIGATEMKFAAREYYPSNDPY
jgi:aspergillopepsin I